MPVQSNLEKLAEILRKRREELDLTLDQVASAADCSVGHLSNLETARFARDRRKREEVLIGDLLIARLAQALRVSPDKLHVALGRFSPKYESVRDLCITLIEAIDRAEIEESQIQDIRQYVDWLRFRGMVDGENMAIIENSPLGHEDASLDTKQTEDQSSG